MPNRIPYYGDTVIPIAIPAGKMLAEVSISAP